MADELAGLEPVGDLHLLCEHENRTLRARLAAREAERDEWKNSAEYWRKDRDEYSRRLREVEAERDALAGEVGNLTMADAAVEWRKAEARLNAVLALCSDPSAIWTPVSGNSYVRLDRVRAAAREEGDQPAEYVRRCDCATPGNCDGCHCWRGEGDR